MPNKNTAAIVAQEAPPIFKNLSIYKRGFVLVIVPVLIQAFLLVALWFLCSSSDAHAVRYVVARMEAEHLRNFIAAETYVLVAAEQAYINNSDFPPLVDQKLALAGMLAERIKDDTAHEAGRANCLDEIAAKTASVIYETKRGRLVKFMVRQKAKATPTAVRGASAAAALAVPSAAIGGASSAGVHRLPSAAALDVPSAADFETSLVKVEALLDGLAAKKVPVSSDNKAANLRHILYLVVVNGSIINLLSMLLVVFVFNRDLVQRILVLYENTGRLARGDKLLPALSGTDEIAQLDKAFHTTALALENSIRKDKALFNSVRSVLASVDRQGRIQEVNAAAVKVLGFEPQELTERYIEDLVPAEAQYEIIEQVKLICAGVEKPFELAMLRKDGRLAHTLWSAKYVKDEQKIFCVVQDVSERFEAESMRKQVLQMVSHDLRNPLATIGMVYSLLETGLFVDFTKEGRDGLVFAKAKLVGMLTLVNNLLDIEKIEAGMLSLELEAVAVSLLFDSAIDQERQAIRIKNINLYTSGSSLTIIADKYRVIQVLSNLLSKAVERSPEGGKVRMTAAQKAGGPITFSISDDGPIISQRAIEQIFSRFQQADDANSFKPGRSDLSMAISKSLVELHSGHIWVNSTPTETNFCFSIKVGQAEASRG